MENVAGVNTRGQRRREQKNMNGGLEGGKLCKGTIAVEKGETGEGGKLVWNLIRAEK